MPARIKICGITNLEDAQFAVEAGADALGFIFYSRSPRYVQPSTASRIISSLPPFVTKVGVFVNSTLEDIQEVLRLTAINVLQLHGDETPEFCAGLNSPVIKAFRIRDQNSLRDLINYQTAAYLLDSYVPGQLGGTGEKFNWDLALEAKRHKRPIILAGGLTPENVADAVAKVQPYAVDVSSGVERSLGMKDKEKVREFILNARR